MSAIATIRTRLDLTQKELGAALGVTQGNVSLYEKGQVMPPPVAKLLIEFAAGLGVRVSLDDIYADVELASLEREVSAAKTAA